MATQARTKVLLVEDSLGLRRVYQRLLEAHHYEVLTAEQGVDALTVLTKHTVDVVVSDIGMPLMDGFELARRLRANPVFQHLRLIALTAYSQPSLVEEARRAGFDSYLTKPINITDLTNLIDGNHVSVDYFQKDRAVEHSEASTLRQRLRSSTRTLHEELEQQLDLLRPELDLACYRGFLEKMYGFYLPLEDRLLAAAQSKPWFSQVVARSKIGALQEDLRWLGLTEQAIAGLALLQTLPAVSNLSDVLGVMYVLEGSTLGGQILSKHFHRRWGLDRHGGATFINTYGDAVADNWSRFLDWLETDADDEDRVVNAASETFKALYSWQLVRNGAHVAKQRSTKTIHGSALRSNNL